MRGAVHIGGDARIGSAPGEWGGTKGGQQTKHSPGSYPQRGPIEKTAHPKMSSYLFLVTEREKTHVHIASGVGAQTPFAWANKIPGSTGIWVGIAWGLAILFLIYALIWGTTIDLFFSGLQFGILIGTGVCLIFFRKVWKWVDSKLNGLKEKVEGAIESEEGKGFIAAKDLPESQQGDGE